MFRNICLWKNKYW